MFLCTNILIKGNTSIMKAAYALLVLLGGALLSCTHNNPSPREWSTGYWMWGAWEEEDSAPASSRQPVDLIAFNMGEPGYQVSYLFHTIEPGNLPAARRYIAVIRTHMDPFTRPKLAPAAIKRFQRLQYRFREAHRELNEIQLDFDCPTNSLPQYADWLEQWRRELPQGTRLTVTALLDWFRPGTEIGRVLSKVDGFVPQFYDVETAENSRIMPKISYPPDHAKWGPIFERFNIPYRIGLSSFGRVQGGDIEFGDARLNAKAELRVSINDSGERVIETTQPDVDGAPGKYAEIQPTAESIARGYKEARAMGNHCIGVMFFRWPAIHESLALTPDEITDILAGKAPGTGYSVESEDAGCASVECSDLSLIQNDRFPSHARVISLTSSTPLEYFLPCGSIKPTVNQSDKLQFRIPAYNAETKIYLGRAVSKKPAQYTVQVLP
jgi:hypothetical protein